MATFHGFTEGSFAFIDADSTINGTDFVVGYTGSTEPGSERKISLESLKRYINKDPLLGGHGVANSNEGGQINLCSSSNGQGIDDPSWRMDTITRSNGSDNLRFFTDGGKGSITFDSNGKIVIGGSDEQSNGSSLLILPRASNEVLPGQWIVTSITGSDVILTYGGSQQEWDDGKGDLLDMIVSAGESKYGDSRERKGWHAITEVRDADKEIRLHHVSVQLNDQVRLYKEDSALEILGKNSNGDDFTRFKIDSSGITSTGLFDVDGDIRTSGSVITQSDGRYKDDITTISNGIESIKQLRGVSYFKKNSKTRDMGIIAQEVEEVLPELVVTHSSSVYDDEKSVNYTGIIPVLIEAIKEQQQQIEELQERVS